jgi:secondary thiamine-phosphate synthase enzyme
VTTTSTSRVLFTFLPTLEGSRIFPLIALGRARRRMGQDGGMSDAFTTRVLNITTGSAERVVDLTRDCEAFLREVARGRDGLLNLFVPHATAGIAIIETGAGSDDDLLAALHTILPADDRWQHRHGSPGHGRDHVLPAFVPPHATLPVVDGGLELGTWQSVCLVDTNRDNAERKVRFSFLAGS